jgi:hypothetical protein
VVEGKALLSSAAGCVLVMLSQRSIIMMRKPLREGRAGHKRIAQHRCGDCQAACG